MKIMKWLSYLIIGLCSLFLTGAFITGCVDGKKEETWSSSVTGDVHTAGSTNIFTLTKNESQIVFNLKACPGGKFPTGGFDNTWECARPFWIAQTEVTYDLWYTVYTWATANGYTFAYPGREGSSGQEGSAPTADKRQPVTDISWRDIIIWCNALTEYYNTRNGSEPDLVCVYYTDKDRTTPLRKCDKSVTIRWDEGPGPWDGSQDDPYVNKNADGFRLPMTYEWECAARYIEDKNGNGDIMDPGEYYPGLVPSGASIDGANRYGATEKAMEEAVWYYKNSNGTSHEVGQKPTNGNALGCFDMDGNVYEMCFDDLPFFSDAGVQKNYHATRGGCFYSVYPFEVAASSFCRRRPPWATLYSMGFRPVRNQ